MTNALDYAPILPWYRRNKWRMRFLLLLLLAALALCTWLFGPRLYHRAMFFYWQHRSLTRVDPPGKVMMEAAMDAKQNLTATGQPFPPPELEAALNHLPPGPGKKLLDGFQVKGTSRYPVIFYLRGQVTVFCHSRTSAAGERLIVVMGFPHETDLGPAPAGNSSSIYAGIIVPGTLFSPPRLEGLYPIYADRQYPGESFRVFAGRCDPADAALFIIPIETNGKREELRCRLNAAANGIEVERK